MRYALCAVAMAPPPDGGFAGMEAWNHNGSCVSVSSKSSPALCLCVAFEQAHTRHFRESCGLNFPLLLYYSIVKS
jgi:hypothetical protein